MPLEATDTLDIRRALMQCGECKQRFGVEATFCPFDGTRLDRTAWDPTGDPLVGRVIDGRYEVAGIIGEGGMGTVYKVRHIALDRVFALKALRRDLARDQDLSARFMREARATALVKHPNVVAITDFGRLDASSVRGGGDFLPDGGVPYFVMEHLAGETLAQSLRHGGAVPSALAVRIIVQIAAALGAAHEAKIVHRDLKPDNVFLLGKQGRETDVRVVDFGAAMILGASRTTKTGVVFGTPHYMSPEQASGQPIDHRADVYALGVIMYEMFTGRAPFLADTYMGVLTQHMFVAPTPPSQVSEHARELGALEDVVLRALEKRPEHRFLTMKALAEEIERVTSFAPDGSLRVAPRAKIPSRPAFSPTGPAFGASEENVMITRTTTRRRRARARAWVIYAGVSLGVATLAITAQRLLVRGPVERTATPPPSVPVAVASTVAPPAPAPSPASSPVASVAPRPSAAASQPSPPPPRSASRPRPVTSAAPRSTSSITTDFVDPWSK